MDFDEIAERIIKLEGTRFAATYWRVLDLATARESLKKAIIDDAEGIIKLEETRFAAVAYGRGKVLDLVTARKSLKKAIVNALEKAATGDPVALARHNETIRKTREATKRAMEAQCQNGA